MQDGNTTITATTNTIDEQAHAKAELIAEFARLAPPEPRWGEDRVGAGHWRWFVFDARMQNLGKRPCEECARWTKGDKPCADCLGSGHALAGPRLAYVPSTPALHEGIAALADLVGDYVARGGLEHLPPRSRALIEELHDGLGEKLFELLGRIEDLEEDMQGVPDEVWPDGEPLWHEAMREIERENKAAKAAHAMEGGAE